MAKMTLNGRTILVVAGEGLETLDSEEMLAPSANNVWIPGLYLKFITVELCLTNNKSHFIIQDQISKTCNGDITHRQRSYCYGRMLFWREI